MTILARTEKQISRDHRDSAIAAEYAAYRKAFPTASASQIVRTIVKSQKFDMSEPGIKRVLYRTGAIKPKSRS